MKHFMAVITSVATDGASVCGMLVIDMFYPLNSSLIIFMTLGAEIPAHIVSVLFHVPFCTTTLVFVFFFPDEPSAGYHMQKPGHICYILKFLTHCKLLTSVSLEFSRSLM